MRKIVLNTIKTTSVNYRKYVALIDDEDFEIVSKYKWNIHRYKGLDYASSTHVSPNGKRIPIKMHRLIMGCLDDKYKIVDHKDRNGLNNQKSNLRFATKSENNKNKIGVGASKYLGVSLHRCKFKRKIKGTNEIETAISSSWVVRISINMINTHIGTFKTEIEAALAYNEAAKKYHGEFARLNVIK